MVFSNEKRMHSEKGGLEIFEKIYHTEKKKWHGRSLFHREPYPYSSSP